MFTSYPITIYPDSPLYDSVCEGGTGNLFNSGNDDPEECIKQAIVNHCIKVTSNYKEACITWTTNQTPMYICASFPDIPEAGCTSYGDRPELEITHINGEEAVANEDDDKFYVCDDDILTIAITDFDAEKNLVYGWLYTSMDIANDYPSDYAVLNGDGTITVEVGNLLEGGNEWCQLASYDPANVGECWSEMGVVTWENANKTNVPLLDTQVIISDLEIQYKVVNSGSYSQECIFRDETSQDLYTITSSFNNEDEYFYILVTMNEGAPTTVDTQIFIEAKDGHKCWSDRGTQFLNLNAHHKIVAIQSVFIETFNVGDVSVNEHKLINDFRVHFVLFVKLNGSATSSTIDISLSFPLPQDYGVYGANGDGWDLCNTWRTPFTPPFDTWIGGLENTGCSTQGGITTWGQPFPRQLLFAKGTRFGISGWGDTFSAEGATVEDVLGRIEQTLYQEQSWEEDPLFLSNVHSDTELDFVSFWYFANLGVNNAHGTVRVKQGLTYIQMWSDNRKAIGNAIAKYAQPE